MQPMENLSVAYLHLHSVIGISLCKICDVTKRSPSDRLPVLVVSWRGCTPSQSCVVPKSSGIALLQTEKNNNISQTLTHVEMGYQQIKSMHIFARYKKISAFKSNR